MDGDGHLSKSDISKKFAVGSTVRGRVIGFRLVDGLCAMSLKESVLAQQVTEAWLMPHRYLIITAIVKCMYIRSVLFLIE